MVESRRGRQRENSVKLKSFSAMVAIAAASIVASNAYAGPNHSFVEQNAAPGQANVVTVGDKGLVSEKRMSVAQAAKIAKAGPSAHAPARSSLEQASLSPLTTVVEQSAKPGMAKVVVLDDAGRIVSEREMPADQAAKLTKSGPAQDVDAGQQALRQADSKAPGMPKGSDLGMAASKLGSMLPMNPFMKAGLGVIEKAKAGSDERKANGDEAKPVDKVIDVGGQAVDGAKKLGTSALGFAGGLLDKLKAKRAESDVEPAQNNQPNNGM